MDKLQAYDLSSSNSFRLPCVADKTVHAHSSKEAIQFCESLLAEQKLLVLGGGTNVVLPPRLTQTVLQIKDQQVRVSQVDDATRVYRVGAGMVWDELVQLTVSEGYFGLENLSWIPGLVGAAPVQNIGAYGVEVKSLIDSVSAFDRTEKRLVELDSNACEFAYRDSIFKRNPGRFIIIEVAFLLSRTRPMNLDYAPLNQLSLDGARHQVVRELVIETRQSKLPDYRDLPNAGSFFKNPILSLGDVERLRVLHPNMPVFSLSKSHCKVAAGWLIDQCGFKGQREENVGVHEDHALVLVNLGGTREQLLGLASKIQTAVCKRFDVNLEIEPVVV